MVNFKSIKSELLTCFLALIIIICIGISSISMFVSKKALVGTGDIMLPEVAKQAAISVENAMNVQMKTLEFLSENDKIKNENTPLEEKIAILSAEAKRSGHMSMSITDINGQSISTLGQKSDVNDREYFKKAKEGKNNVSDPIISKADGNLIVVYTVPIKNNGNIIGCLSAIRNGDELSSYSNNVKFGKTGEAFMIKKDGTIIAYNKKELVLRQDNNFENVKKDPELQSLVDIEKKMIAGEVGVGEYTYKGANKYVGYAPIKSTGWSIAILVESKEVLSQIDTLKISIIIASAIFIILGGFIVVFLSSFISKPVKDSMDCLKSISNGDLTLEISKNLMHRQDEIGEMAKSIDIMKNSILSVIKDININSENIDEQAKKLTDTAEEVASSTENVSISINDVAKGAVKQAQDLLGITNILEDFSSKLEEMVDVMKNVNMGTNNIKEMADHSNKDMETVIKSVSNVNDAFKDLIVKIDSVGSNVSKINEITNLINSISEQTNLLALNAAIEAARAGEAGKGFSVVADEIRKLAEQSQESSVNISNLITEVSKDTSVMVNTTDIMKTELKNQETNIYTAIESFQTITEAVEDIKPKMEMANSSVTNLNNAKDNILTKIDTTSAIAQEMSASSEEISVSSEELSKSTGEITNASQLLNDMSKNMLNNVNRFKIK